MPSNGDTQRNASYDFSKWKHPFSTLVRQLGSSQSELYVLKNEIANVYVEDSAKSNASPGKTNAYDFLNHDDEDN